MSSHRPPSAPRPQAPLPQHRPLVSAELSPPQPTWTVADVAVPVPADGHFNPEVVKYRQLCFRSQYKRYLSSQQQYFHRLLKQILASRSVSDRPPGSGADTHLVTWRGGRGSKERPQGRKLPVYPQHGQVHPSFLRCLFRRVLVSETLGQREERRPLRYDEMS